jgi:hypothetical protein
VVLILTALLVSISGCKNAGQGVEEQKAIETFQAMMSAFRDKDTNTLWKLCDRKTTEFFQTLGSQIDEARALIERCYPEKEKEGANKAILGDIVPRGASGKEVFMALVDPSALRVAPDKDSYLVEKVVVGGNKALVMTKESEVFEFIREDDAFKTAQFLEAVIKKPWYSTLMENLKTIREDCKNKSGAQNEKD